MNRNFFILLWTYILFVGTHGPRLWHVEHKVYYALFITLMLVLILVGSKSAIHKLKPLIWIIVLVNITFVWKAYILQSSGAFVYSIPLLGAPFALLAFSDYLVRFSKRKWIGLSSSLLCFLVVELGLALFERLIGVRIFGNPNIDEKIDIIETGIYGFRSTALWGHPLSNALIVSTIMSFLLVSSLKIKYKLSLWAIGYVAILCFNTRGSIIGNALIIITYFCYVIFYKRRVKLTTKASMIIIMFCITMVILILLQTTGLGGRLTHGSLDDSSVHTRIDIWNVFHVMKRHDILYGTDNKGIGFLMDSAGLYTLENFWIILIMRFGIIFLFLYAFCYTILFKALFVGYSMFEKSIIIGTFVLLASTNNSLADGFSALFVFMICTYIFKPKYFNHYMNPKYIDSGFDSSRVDYKKRILRIIRNRY